MKELLSEIRYSSQMSRMTEITFDFSADVIAQIIKEIHAAEKYVRIAIFQLHNLDVIKALETKLKQGVQVEIITLPYDSINKDIRPNIEAKLRQLEKDGVNLHFNKWNIGDPSRTTTAVGRWYLFHGKFMVTEKSAIALSANLTEDQELDALIISRNDATRIGEFNKQFERLLDLFVVKDGSFDGTIHRKIVEAEKTEAPQLFELPENIGPEHSEHWVRQYPAEICLSATHLETKLYLTPFDCKGRDILMSAIDDAEHFAYISTESFTDIDFSNFLVTTAINKGIEIKVLTGATSMDFTDRMESMLRDLLAHGIDVRTIDEDLHAKLLITDKMLIVSSINLNKMNLGFSTSRKYWRENTESAFICKELKVVNDAKEKYLTVLRQSYDVQIKLTEKLENMVKDTLAKTFGLTSSPDARKLFAQFILKKQLEVRQTITKIGRIAKKLMNYYKRDRIEKDDFVAATILYYLSERKQDVSDLRKNVSEIIDPKTNLNAILNALEFAQFIEKEEEHYKINVEALFP